MRPLVLLVVLLAGCDVSNPNLGWKTAPQTHACTIEQHTKVESEAAFCKAQSGYISTYCYGAAIMRNCTKMQQKTA